MTTTHKAVRAALIAALQGPIGALPGSMEFVVDDPRLIDVDEEAGIRRKVALITGRRPEGQALLGGVQTIYDCDHQFVLVVDAVGYEDAARYEAVEAVIETAQTVLEADWTLGGIAAHARITDTNPETDKPEGQLPEMIAACAISVLYSSLRPTG
ncbi:hypothetical protein FKB34_01815 [Glycocaulis profundi]|nr:hypothetical protein FKB34_01815 [Glycocaulis profundi]